MTSGCREVRRLLEAYLDGELAPAQVLEVEAHAGACAVCGERLALDRAVRTAIEMMNELRRWNALRAAEGNCPLPPVDGGAP